MLGHLPPIIGRNRFEPIPPQPLGRRPQIHPQLIRRLKRVLLHGLRDTSPLQPLVDFVGDDVDGVYVEVYVEVDLLGGFGGEGTAVFLAVPADAVGGWVFWVEVGVWVRVVLGGWGGGLEVGFTWSALILLNLEGSHHTVLVLSEILNDWYGHFHNFLLLLDNRHKIFSKLDLLRPMPASLFHIGLTRHNTIQIGIPRQLRKFILLPTHPILRHNHIPSIPTQQPLLKLHQLP
jgi:hypothetical protein